MVPRWSALRFRGTHFRIWSSGVPIGSAATIFRLMVLYLAAYVGMKLERWYFHRVRSTRTREFSTLSQGSLIFSHQSFNGQYHLVSLLVLNGVIGFFCLVTGLQFWVEFSEVNI